MNPSPTRAATPATPDQSWRSGIVPGLWLTLHSGLMISASPIASMKGVWPLAIVSLLPVAFAALHLARAPRSAVAVAACGFLPWWFTTHFWLINVSLAGFLPLVFLLSFFDAAAVLLIARLARRNKPLALLLFPFVWTGMNHIRGEYAFDGYAWGWASHPLIDAPFLAFPAAIVGIYGVTFLLASLSAALIHARLSSRRSAWLAPSCVLLLWSLLSWAGFSQASTAANAPPVRFAIIQTNVPQDNKLDWTVEQETRDFLRFKDLTLSATAATPAPDVVVWPETMAPGMTLAPQALRELSENQIFVTHADGTRQWATYFADSLLDLSESIKVPMIVGEIFAEDLAIDSTPEGGVRIRQKARYNAAFVLRNGKIERQWYFKHHLTPFGEVMPYISAWPWLERQLLSLGARGMSFDLDSGSDLTVLTVPAADGRDVRCVTPICFESTDSPLLRKLVFSGAARRADIIVNLTNDGWFSFSNLTRRQHLQAARWRSLETLTPTIRAANTGISAVINADGSILASGVNDAPAAAEVDGVLSASVQLPVAVPTFARLGNALAGLCSGATLLLMLAIGLGRVVGARRRQEVIPRTPPGR